MSGLPIGTVTLLLGGVDSTVQLWQTRPDEMANAIARLNRLVSGVVDAHAGTRPAEQGEGESFVLAFARASDAVACALELQAAPLAPVRLRIGIHTGEVQLHGDANYIGLTINCAARLRDLAHGGQTVMSAATEQLVVDRLPAGAWLADRGTHQLRDLPRPERVVQLCHPDLPVDFPPLVSAKAVAAQHLPVQLTSFVGRGAQIVEVRRTLSDKRVVTLTGAGGVGKTRLAVQIADQLGPEFGDGVWYVDLASITDPGVLVAAVGRALGLPDLPGRSTLDTLVGFVSNRRMLLVLDNCEHLLDQSASLAAALLSACPAVTLLATSREPIGVPGEVTWQVPSLSIADEAIDLFTDRARDVRPEFSTTRENSAAVAEICRRLDGIPLAIELAAARLRSLSLAELLDGLHDRFRLLTGGARTVVHRQQTLRASMDWSHALLTQSECVLFRRLAVFLGGFDLAAAQAVCRGGELEHYQVFDQLTLLVDKSLIAVDNTAGRTRYRMQETVRQYAFEKLGESGEGGVVRQKHCNYYTAMVATLNNLTCNDYRQSIEQAESEIDNLRAAFGWSNDRSDMEGGLRLASALQVLWQGRGYLQEGLAWFRAVLTDDRVYERVTPAVRARALADMSVLESDVAGFNSMDQALEALAIARDIGDSALLTRALIACGYVAGADMELARPYFDEATGLAREISDVWALSQILGRQAYSAVMVGDPIAARAIAEEGCEVADAVGDWFSSHLCRWSLASAQMFQGDMVGAIAQFDSLSADAERDHDVIVVALCNVCRSIALALHGDADAAEALACAAIEVGADLDAFYEHGIHAVLALVALAAGDVKAARRATNVVLRQGIHRAAFVINMAAATAFASGDLTTAGSLADEAVAAGRGWHRVWALTIRARATIARGDHQKAKDDAHEALALAAADEMYAQVPDILEFLGRLAVDEGAHPEGARLVGAADAIRQRTGAVRFPMYEEDYQKLLTALRSAMGDEGFKSGRSQGAALSSLEATAYAQRGRGERKRPTSGWESLTPAERKVVDLVAEGLPNKGIAERLLVSPRTVHAHLTNVYSKLGLTSRIHLAREAHHHAASVGHSPSIRP